MRQERIELQGAAAGGGFRAAEHDADFFADLVDENHAGFALGNGAGQFAHGLAHQPGLQADVRIAHFAVQFLLRNQGGDGVDDDDVDGVALDEHFGDVHGLFAAAGLADQQRFEIDAQFFGPGGVEGMFGIDEGGDAAGRCARATTCRASVVLPLDSGPKISMMRPLGRPTPPRARSSDRLPVGMPWIWRAATSPAPSGMMEPSPNGLFDLGDGGFELRMIGQRVVGGLGFSVGRLSLGYFCGQCFFRQ